MCEAWFLVFSFSTRVFLFVISKLLIFYVTGSLEIIKEIVWHLGLACAPLLQKENIGGAQALESQVEEDRKSVV